MDEELDYFVADILQSQRNLVQKETSAEKSPKVLNSQSATVSSPTTGTGNYVHNSTVIILLSVFIPVQNQDFTSKAPTIYVYHEWDQKERMQEIAPLL